VDGLNGSADQDQMPSGFQRVVIRAGHVKKSTAAENPKDLGDLGKTIMSKSPSPD